MAAQYGKLEICDVLLRMKADPNAKDQVCNFVRSFTCMERYFLPASVTDWFGLQKGLTPLHLAAENDHSLIVELF